MTPPRNRSLQDHYAASQFRTEAWHQLQQSTASLRSDTDAGRDASDQATAVRAALALLTRIESYWAFPGVRICTELTRLLDGGEYAALALKTSRVVRLLVSHSYRSCDATHGRPGWRRTLRGRSAHGRGGGRVPALLRGDGGGRPRRRGKGRAARGAARDARPDDEFVYDIVVVPTFEDAVIGVLFNHNVQSCVMRYRFPIASRVQIPELRHFLDFVDPRQRERAETEPSGGARRDASRASGPSWTSSRSPTTRSGAWRRAAPAASGACSIGRRTTSSST